MDFHYEGTDYSIPGNSQILLSELIDILNITYPAETTEGEETTTTKLEVKDVESITFTDEHLVTVQEVTGLITYNGAQNVDVGEKDFLLTSLEPFTTEEKLTIRLVSAEEILVGVTDVQASGNLMALVASTPTSANDSAEYIKASVSSTITESEQSRTTSFNIEMSYKVTDDTLSWMKSYNGGYPTLVYDISDFLKDAPVTVSDSSGAIKVNGDQVGEYRLDAANGKYYLEYTDLLWLRQQVALKGTFTLKVTVDEEKLGSEEEWHIDLPGTSSTITIPFKKVDYRTEKTVQFDGSEDYRGAFVTKKDDGYYYLNYTATFNTPIDLKGLTFKDVLEGDQTLYGDVTITPPGGTAKVVALNATPATGSTFSFDVPSNMTADEYGNTIKAGTYTVNYTTRVSWDKVKDYDESGIVSQKNTAAWHVEGKTDDVPGGNTEVKIVKEPLAPGGYKVSKTVNGAESLSGKQPGDTLNYVITFGEAATETSAATDLSEVVISDYMTDTQKLVGNITITYANGTTSEMPVVGPNGQWDGGVIWNNDNNYSVNNTDLFRYKLPKDTVGPVIVSYSTQIISKDEAVAANLWGETLADNWAKLNNTTDWTHTTVTTPEQPNLTKTVTGNARPKTGETGETWAYGQTLSYTLTYGSDDVKVGGTTITDTMTALQNLAGDVVITFKDGTTFNMPVGQNGVVWNKDSYYPGTEDRQLFNYTFPSEYDNKYGAFTVTYTTTVLTKEQAETTLNLFGTKDIRNTFTVNGRNAQTIGHVDTQEPVEVHKVVNNEKSITADPGDTVNYTVTFGKPGEDMGRVHLYDQMTDIQSVIGEVSIVFGDNSSATVVPQSNAADTNYGNYWVNVLDYEVPEGKTGVITVTYQSKLADKNTLNNLGYYGNQHAYNHVSTSKGGSDDTDITVDYGKKPDYALTKGAEIVTDSGTAGWSAGDRIKWTVTYGDSSTDMRGMVLQDTMQFTQKLDESLGVEIKIGSENAFKLDNATDRWNSEGVLYRTDDNVNQNAYGLWTEVPVFKYTVPSDSETPVLGPIVVTYYTTLLNEGEAWGKNITGIQNVYNKAGLGDKWITDSHETDFGTPPVPAKTAYTGATQAAAEANTTAHRRLFH